MPQDGHTGISNGQVNQGGSGNFQLILSALKYPSGRVDFVVHATSNAYSFSGLQPSDFLVQLGFAPFSGQCQFFHDRCHFRVIAHVIQARDGMEHFGRIQGIHQAFQSFAGQIHQLYELRKQEEQITRQLNLAAPGEVIFNAPVDIEIPQTDVPLWVDDVKFQRLRDSEQLRATLQREIDDLSGYLPLLYGTGDALESAVIKALEPFGLKAVKTAPGFTADIIAQTTDGTRQFGLEVTGIGGAINKGSKKLTQVLEFERIKEHGEKTVLVANTHNGLPIPQRRELEDFTQPVLDFLGRHPILLMTGWELYQIVRDVLEGARTPAWAVDLLWSSEGRLQYPPAP